MRTSPIAVAFLVIACAAPPQHPPPPQPLATAKGQRELELLTSFFTGNWDAKPHEPPMRMRVAEFWKGSPARWFYLEWTRPGQPKPARQMVVRVAELAQPGNFRGDVYRLPEPSRHVGEWAKPQPFATLEPEDLRVDDDCRMSVVHTMTAAFTLVTEGNRCKGDIPGSPYMRFEFSVTSSDLDLLEQPRDASGEVTANSRLEPFNYARTARDPG